MTHKLNNLSVKQKSARIITCNQGGRVDFNMCKAKVLSQLGVRIFTKLRQRMI